MMRAFFVLMACLAACGETFASDRPRIVVTTSLLSTALQDLDGDAFDIQELMPPGTCPGQFDLEPSQALGVRHADLVIRHTHQAFLDRLFLAAGAPRNRIVVQDGGFIIPEDYLKTCERLADTLIHRFPSEAPSIHRNLTVLRARLDALAARMQTQVAGLRHRPVVAAMFQADFLRWLGLDVAFVLPPTDDPGPGLVKNAIAAGERSRAIAVVGNVQNGERVPQLVAETLNIPCAMLGNFPPHASPGAQDKLMEDNLHALLAATARR